MIAVACHTKVVCNRCGWDLVVMSHFGDVITPRDMFNAVPECGRCGSKDLRERAATFLETKNPIEYVRKWLYIGKRVFGKEGGRLL